MKKKLERALRKLLLYAIGTIITLIVLKFFNLAVLVYILRSLI